MSYRLRTVIGVIVLELVLAGLWYLGMMPDAQGRHHWNSPEAPREFSEMMGMAMGGLAGLSPLLFLMAWRNDRRKRERQQGR